MMNVRQVTDFIDPLADRTIAQAQHIIRSALPGVRAAEIDSIPARIKGVKQSAFETRLLVAENSENECVGLALLSYCSSAQFCLLEYLATDFSVRNQGIGALLYTFVRTAASKYRSLGLFFECSPDDAHQCSVPEVVRENAARLRFYERWGARPIINNRYNLATSPGQMDLPYLVYDSLGLVKSVGTNQIRAVVTTILREKYGYICTPQYISKVVNSFCDSQIELRPFKYKSAVKLSFLGPIEHPEVDPSSDVRSVSTDRL